MARMRRYPIWMDRENIKLRNINKRYRNELKSVIKFYIDKEDKYIREIKFLESQKWSLQDYINKKMNISARIDYIATPDIPKKYVEKEVRRKFFEHLNDYLKVDEIKFFGDNLKAIKVNPYDERKTYEYFVRIDIDAYQKAAEESYKK